MREKETGSCGTPLTRTTPVIFWPAKFFFSASTSISVDLPAPDAPMSAIMALGCAQPYVWSSSRRCSVLPVSLLLIGTV